MGCKNNVECSYSCSTSIKQRRWHDVIEISVYLYFVFRCVRTMGTHLNEHSRVEPQANNVLLNTHVRRHARTRAHTHAHADTRTHLRIQFVHVLAGSGTGVRSCLPSSFLPFMELNTTLPLSTIDHPPAANGKPCKNLHGQHKMASGSNHLNPNSKKSKKNMVRYYIMYTISSAVQPIEI